MVDIKCGSKSILVLTAEGNVFLKQGDQNFIKLHFLSDVKEIGACMENYAALTCSNVIYNWKEGEFGSFKKIENPIHKTLEHMTIGKDFGHLLDLDANLYGWGDNAHGELGTSDSFPRYKLSQIRIFN
jgi:alpha-tubulin suppressor-like RCC1 family protein